MKQRTVKVAGPQLEWRIRDVYPWATDLPLGIVLHADDAVERQTDEQRNSFHLLLSWWLETDPDIAPNLDRLKTRVLMSKFGAARVEDRHGNITFIPLRRTTQIFDWDLPGYKRKLLSRKLYIELIDHVYQMASEDGTLLPELDPEKATA